MKHARISITSLDAFPRPQSVRDADAMRLSPAMADAELVGELRRNAMSDRLYIGELEANGRAQSDIIRDLQEDLHALDAEPILKLVHTFWDHSTPAKDMLLLTEGLVALGHDVVMRFDLEHEGHPLRIYVSEAA